MPSDPVPTRRWVQHGAGRVQSWHQCMEPAALSVFLNFRGEADLTWKAGGQLLLRASTLSWVRGPAEGLSARRLPGKEDHECLALYFPDAWIASTLRNTETGILSELRLLITPPLPGLACVSHPITQENRIWAQSFMAPHLCEQARYLLDTARLTEFFLRSIFAPPSAPAESVSRTERLARERVSRAKAAVLPRLDDPPPLEELAVIAGCSPHYLSRTFTQVEGLTFSLWLRRVRIEKAAELIAAGECNVSEAAIEVGYRSFSHFSHAFFEEKGVQPSRWVGKAGRGLNGDH